MSKDVVVTSVDQIVEKDMRIADLETRPEHILRWFSNNILRRMLGYLVGWTGKEYKILRCTNKGVLEVSSIGGSFRSCERIYGYAGAGFAYFTFTSDDISRLMITIWDHRVYVRFYSDLVNVYSDIELNADTVYEFDLNVKKFGIQRIDSGVAPRFQFIGFKKET